MKKIEIKIGYATKLETDAKKFRLAEKLAIIKKSQFLSNQADIQATLPTHELIIFS